MAYLQHCKNTRWHDGADSDVATSEDLRFGRRCATAALRTVAGQYLDLDSIRCSCGVRPTSETWRCDLSGTLRCSSDILGSWAFDQPHGGFLK